MAAELCRLLDRGLHRVTRRSKQGLDISEAPASREMESVLEAFSDEAGLLEEEQRRERAAQRRAAAAAAADERRKERLAAWAARAGLSGVPAMAEGGSRRGGRRSRRESTAVAAAGMASAGSGS